MSNLLGRPLLLLPYVLPTLACKYTFLLLAFYISRYLLSIQLEAWGWNRSIEQHILEGDAVSAWFCKLWLRLMFAKCEDSSGTALPQPPQHTSKMVNLHWNYTSACKSTISCKFEGTCWQGKCCFCPFVKPMLNRVSGCWSIESDAMPGHDCPQV